jgi:hypothetical protein
MATNATQRETIAQAIMRKGNGVVCIANPRGASVDVILIKSPSYRVPANSTDVKVWVEMTGDDANAEYLP